MKSKLPALNKASENLKDSLKRCAICPRRCGVDRTAREAGYCRAPANPVVYSFQAHHGEEPPISGDRGSGTIFFSHCNMKCVYCQNYYFSQLDKGSEITIEKLSDIMLHLQKLGCHNINLVNPSHFVPQIVSALEIACKKGLDIPIVYNTSGYDLTETLKALDGIIDVYLPDMRYSDDKMAAKYSDAPNYVKYDRAAIKEMQAQVGDLATDRTGIAVKGLIIRLLALPGAISGTKKSLEFIKENISKNAYLSIMSQYYPTFKSYSYKELSRGISAGEYKNVVDACRLLELNNGWLQSGPGGPDDRFLGTKIPPREAV